MAEWYWYSGDWSRFSSYGLYPQQRGVEFVAAILFPIVDIIENAGV